jgi:prepilin-type N-terminal cleavage/methylation domain-containing protein
MKSKRQAYSDKRIEKFNPEAHTLFAKRYSLNARSRGFTLVEMIVAVGLFSFVMLVSVGALLALTGANRKAQALQSVMNNLNVALDGMVRSIRMGSDYHCGSGGIFTDPLDCLNGDTTLVFESFGGDSNNSGDQWVYSYYSSDSRIYKSVDGGAHNFALTSPEIIIDRDSMKFYVVGTTKGDTEQPKVVITAQGTAGSANLKTKTTFSIQATAVQRLLDL